MFLWGFLVLPFLWGYSSVADPDPLLSSGFRFVSGFGFKKINGAVLRFS
jgi:hypothetical protein